MGCKWQPSPVMKRHRPWSRIHKRIGFVVTHGIAHGFIVGMSKPEGFDCQFNPNLRLLPAA